MNGEQGRSEVRQGDENIDIKIAEFPGFLLLIHCQYSRSLQDSSFSSLLSPPVGRRKPPIIKKEN